MRNIDGFIERVIAQTGCSKHKTPDNTACFTIPKADGGVFFGICNSRAKKHGFNAPISNDSLNRGQIIRANVARKTRKN